VTQPIAHAGHWLPSLIFALPPIALVVWILVAEGLERIRNRRRGGAPKG
jgi:hypothetical protein